MVNRNIVPKTALLKRFWTGLPVTLKAISSLKLSLISEYRLSGPVFVSLVLEFMVTISLLKQ